MSHLRLTQAEFDRLQKKAHATTPAATAPRLDGKRYEIEFAAQLDHHHIEHEREYRFHRTRRWRFDFAFHDFMIAVEIDGQVHRIEERFKADREKFNAALMLGWQVLHVGKDQVMSGDALTMLAALMAQRDRLLQGK